MEHRPALWMALMTCLLGTGCASGAEEMWSVTGSRDGVPVALQGTTQARTFRARLCALAPDDFELNARLGANVEYSGTAELTVEMTTPEEERAQSFTVEEELRIDLEGFPPLDPQAACSTGVSIVFRASEELPGPMTIEWALHYGFHASSELVDAEVELEDEDAP